MCRLFIASFFLLLSSTLVAQDISVKEFKAVPNDLTARVSSPVTDHNGDKCALIKVITNQKGFVWEGDMLGIVKSEKKIGEYWLYIPYGAKYLTIRHDKLGTLRNYKYPIAIKQATVYELHLTTAQVKTIIEEPQIENQWITINTEPEGATVFLNGEMQSGLTPFFKKVKTGTYTYRIELAKYHNNAGKIEVTADKKAEVNLKLNPAFGSIKVSSTPETGATVILNGNPTGKTTPCTLEKIERGEHQIRLMKDMFKPVQQNVTVKDGETTEVTIDLKPNFATLNISTKPEAAIYVDGQQKGIGTWSGRLDAGVHTFEARKDKHKNATKTMEFAVGEKYDINLTPSPRVGNADIVSRPMGATILIDEKMYGTTPFTLSNHLIGNYTLKLEKDGFGTVAKQITIKEDETIIVDEALLTGMKVTLNSDPAGVELYIDGSKVGVTPYNTELVFGSHDIKLVNGKKIVEEKIYVSQGGKMRWNFNAAINLVDERDGQAYKIVTIGSQVWMAQNLNYDAGKGSWCFGNKNQNCDWYGRLYNWETAQNACPDGWHLPSKQEFEILLDNYRGEGKRSYKSLMRGGESGFNAKYSGLKYSTGTNSFGSFDYFLGLWSKSGRSTMAYMLGFNTSTNLAYIGSNYKKTHISQKLVGTGLSVRRIKD